jgi:hypothetical protein
VWPTKGAPARLSNCGSPPKRPLARADPRSSPRFGPLARFLAGAALAPVVPALAMLRSVSCRPDAAGLRVGSGQARQYQTGQPGSRARAAPHGFAVPSDEPAAADPPLADRRGETPRAGSGGAFRCEVETNRSKEAPDSHAPSEPPSPSGVGGRRKPLPDPEAGSSAGHLRPRELGMTGLELVARRRLASEMISTPRSTSHRRCQPASKASRVRSSSTPRTRSPASTMSARCGVCGRAGPRARARTPPRSAAAEPCAPRRAWRRRPCGRGWRRRAPSRP